MSTILQKPKASSLASQSPSSIAPDVVRTSYTSKPVEVPEDFLAPLHDPSVIKTGRIDFANSPLPEYKDYYAVVLDNVLSQQECDELRYMAEISAGGHNEDNEVSNDGWSAAMVNAGPGHEFFAPSYRNSDRIIWDNTVISKRLWTRVLQGKGIKEDLSALEGKKYRSVMDHWGAERGERWVITSQGVNERMRFLKYGPGQFFRPHCDGAFVMPDGNSQTFYTLHFYLNDSVQEMEKENGYISLVDTPSELLRGGATTFHSRDKTRRMDVDPKAGRVLIFQHSHLLHSGDDVVSGTKYTMRSDLLYEFESGSNGIE